MKKITLILIVFLCCLNLSAQHLCPEGFFNMTIADTFYTGMSQHDLKPQVKPQQIDQYFDFCRSQAVITNNIVMPDGKLITRRYDLIHSGEQKATIKGKNVLRINYSHKQNPSLYVRVYLSGQDLVRVDMFNIVYPSRMNCYYSSLTSEKNY